MINYLNDKDFLKEICSKMNRSVSVKITSYTKNNEPIEAIEGRVTQGSINIDGSSSTRRSCSLTILTDNLDIHDFYWSLTTRFSVEIGIVNTTNKYTNNQIIWFPMGYFIISSFSISLSTTGATVSIQGKDKMCMLNGDLGGKLTAETNFGVEDIIDADTHELIHYSIPIKQIIKEAVHEYGQEDYGNIILQDIDDYGLNLETYRGEDPIWIGIPIDEYRIINKLHLIVNPEETYYYLEDNKSIIVSEIPENDLWHDTDLTGEKPGTIFYKENYYDQYYIRKISYGDTIGYLLTDLIYAGELIGKAGENVTNILDKIKTMLGDFEYFYDINGNFIFQKQKAYKTNGAYQMTTDGDGIITDYTYEDIDLTLNNLNLVTSLSNNVQINNLKNDFTVWGQKKGISGGNVPIHMRYAIDSRPTESYNSISILESDVNQMKERYPHQSEGLLPKLSITFDSQYVDWRELIYQMALDYQKLHYTDEYKNKLKERNPQFITGKTGYEQYYTDLLGFWRQLYHPYWEDLPAISDTTIKDLFLPNTYYTFVECKKNDPRNNTTNFYFLNNELPDDDSRKQTKNVNNSKAQDPIKYTIINDKYKFNFSPNNGYKYLYGPLKPLGATVTREFYGNLESIIEQNYKILMYFYFSQYYNFYPEAYEPFPHFKDSCELYYYDPLTCVPAGTYEDNEPTKVQEVEYIDFTFFEQAKKNDCYHKVGPDGQVELYYIWKDITDKSGQVVNTINLFNQKNTWYQKVFYLDENQEEQFTFTSLGDYLPLRPNQIANFSELDYYNMAKLFARNYLQDELKKTDPEEKLNVLSNFEESFKALQAENVLTAEQLYSIVALYTNIKTYFIPMLLSFIREYEVTDAMILNTSDSNQLNSSVENQWKIELFVANLFNPTVLYDETKKSTSEILFLKQLLNNEIEDADLSDEQMNRLGKYTVKELKTCLGKIIQGLGLEQYLTKIIKAFNFVITDPEEQLTNAEKLVSTIIQWGDFSNSEYITLEDLAMLSYIFPRIQTETSKSLKERKQAIAEKILKKLQKDVDSIQTSFKKAWISSREYEVFAKQVEYNFATDILQQEDFEDELNGANEKIVQYVNRKELSINDIENQYMVFDAYMDKDGVYQTVTITQAESPFNTILQQENQETTGSLLSKINNKFTSILNIISLALVKNTVEGGDSNTELIKNIIIIYLGSHHETNKILTWPAEFDLITYWHKDVINAPENLLFWFDFLDTPSSNLQKYSVRNIGQRAMVKNDNNVKVIKYLPTQNIVLINNNPNNEQMDFTYDKQKVDIYQTFHNGYKYLNLFTIDHEQEAAILNINDLTLSAQGKTAFTAIENLLYNYGYATENISITCIPQYFLQPNTKIAIYDSVTRINGEYIISKISFPLSYNGLMQITATKCVDKFERSIITNDK